MSRLPRFTDMASMTQWLNRKREPARLLSLREYLAREEQEHFAFIQWRNVMIGTIPDLRWLFHVPNGELRHPAVGAKLARMGALPGVTDFIWPVRRGRFACMFLELKSKHGKLEPQQAKFIDAMRDVGHFAQVAYGWTQARKFTLQYHETRLDIH